MNDRWIRGAVLAGLVLVLVLYGRGGSGDTITLEGEVLFESSAARAALGRGCDPDGRALVVDPGIGGAKTVHLDRGESTADGCRFTFTVEVPESDRYRVTVPGTDLPARTVARSVMDERGPDGAVRLVLRVSW